MRTATLLTTLAIAGIAATSARAVPVPYPPASTVPGSKDAVTNRVAVAADGTVAVAWGAGNIEIRGKDARWHALHHVAPSNRSVAGVDVLFDAQNKLIATWVQAASAPGHATRGPFQVMASMWTAKTGWGKARALGRSGHFLEASPRITSNAAGDVLIAWHGLRRNAQHQLRDAVSDSFRPVNKLFGPEQQISDGGPYQDVKLDSHGNAYAVWTQATGNSTVNRFAYHRRGGSWGAPKTFSPNPSSLPALAIMPDGGAVIGYRAAQVDTEGNGTQTGGIYMIYRSASGIFDAAQQLDGGYGHEVEVEGSPKGETLLAWTSATTVGGTPHLYTYTRAAHPIVDSSSPTSGRTAFPVAGATLGPLAFTTKGDAWMVYGTSVGDIVITEPLQPFSTFGNPYTLSTTGRYPSLSLQGKHGAVAWLDSTRNRLKLVEFGL